jgi:hypothetical protein
MSCQYVYELIGIAAARCKKDKAEISILEQELDN